MRDIRRNSDSAPERSIRNIPLGHRKASRPSVVADHSDEQDAPMELPELPTRRQRRRRSRYWMWAIAVVVVGGIAGALMPTVFAGATAPVCPRTEEVAPPAVLQAQLNAPVGSLAFKMLMTSRSATTTVPATGTQHVSRPASGVVLLSNTYSTASQRLIANTRFEAQDGKVYRIRDSIVVPGTSGGTAGTVLVTIFADSAGPAYNKPAGTVFTIPGFKGDPRYTKFSAVAQGAISGGFVGDEPAVAAADLATAKAALQRQLDTEVRSAAAAAIPEGYVAIPGTLNISFGELQQSAGSGKTATISQGAVAQGNIVQQSALAAAIARKTVEDYAGEALLFGKGSTLNMVATSTKPTDTTITLALSGAAKLVWQFDPKALKQALVGKDEAGIQAAVSAFKPAVGEIRIKIQPFWQSRFPSDPDRITIVVDGEQ